MTQKFLILETSNFCFFLVLFSQSPEACLERIKDLEQQILSHLRNINEDSDSEDEKEEQNLLEVYKKCLNLSEETSSTLSTIHKKFKKLVSKMEKKLYPDEKLWRKWTGNEFKRSGFEPFFRLFTGYAIGNFFYPNGN